MHYLGTLTHILAGLIALILLRPNPHPALAILTLLFSLLPDIDSASSILGRLFPYISRPLERHFGHRGPPHSILGLIAASGLAYLLFTDWAPLAAAYASHLLVDMVVGEEGVPLFWPATWQFSFLNIRPETNGEALVLALLALTFLLVALRPAPVVKVAEILVPRPPTATPTATPRPTPTPTPRPTPTPHLVTIRIQHVYELSEIKVRPGDQVQTGDLLADLATYRSLLALTPTANTEAEARAALEAAYARLEIAKSHLSEKQAWLQRLEAFTAAGWENVDWGEVEYWVGSRGGTAGRRADVSLHIALADARAEVERAQWEVRAAEAEVRAAKARLESVRATPPPTPAAADTTRIYALIGGQVVEVRIAAVTGNEATVEIILRLD